MKDNSKANLDAINILKGIAYSQLEVQVQSCSCKMKGRDLLIQAILAKVMCLDKLIEK
jgi:hypothetical protein